MKILESLVARGLVKKEEIAYIHPIFKTKETEVRYTPIKEA